MKRRLREARAESVALRAPVPEPRYDFDALFACSGAPTFAEFARWLGERDSVIDRWRRSGVPLRVADRVAVRSLGLHPLGVWPDFHKEAPHVQSRVG